MVDVADGLDTIIRHPDKGPACAAERVGVGLGGVSFAVEVTGSKVRVTAEGRMERDQGAKAALVRGELQRVNGPIHSPV